MDNNEYKDRLDNHKFMYNRMVAVNIMQLIAIIMLIGAVLFFAMNQKIVLKSPFPTNKDETINEGYEDIERLHHFAYYVSGLTQNITYANAKKQLLKVLPLIESNNFDEVRKDLQLEAKYIIKNKISQVFYPANVNVNQENKTIKITGVRARKVNGHTLKDKNNGYQKIILTINYKVKYGSYFRIINLGVKKTR